MKELEKLVDSVDEKVMVELKNFKFKRNSLAYEYLIDAICIVVNEKDAIKNFSCYVYEPVAKKYNTRPQNVLWCINKLIALMYYNTNEEVIEKYFNTYWFDKPTTKAFIIGIAKKIKTDN